MAATTTTTAAAPSPPVAEDAAFTSSTVCFKCAGQGSVRAKKRKRPGLPAVSPTEAEAGHVTVLSVGSKAVHVQRPCTVCQGTGRVVSRRKVRAMAIEGVVTSGRRPPGFVVKGPAPPPERLAAATPEAGEALCFLTGDYRLFQPMAGHRYSTDDVVTAWAAGQELRRLLLPALGHKGVDGSGLRGLDLGTGLGSVLLMMAWQFPSLRYVGIEAQGRNAERARRSCWVNGCEGRAEIKHGDIRALFDAGAGFSPVPEGERGFDIVTGTPPYFDAHGAPAPSSAADPPIDITALPQGNEGDRAVVAVARKAASGRARTQPVPLPAAEDQRPCNFELRGGVEVYCRAAKASLAPQGLFVMCASDLPGVAARVARAADDAGLTLLRKLAVRPKRHQPPLFAVYTFCHAGGEAAAAYRGALRTAGEFPFLVLVDSRPPLSAVGGDDEDAPQLVVVGNGPNMVKETLSVREAGKGGSGGRVPRTDEYRRVMEDMCMPDNDLPCEA